MSETSCHTASIAGTPAAAESSAILARACAAAAGGGLPYSMPMSLSRSNTPKTTAHTRGEADAIARQSTTPAADSIDGITRGSGRPRAAAARAASAAAAAACPASSTFGTTIPSIPSTRAPSRSSPIIPDAGELVRTKTDRAAASSAAMPRAAPATMRRAAAFSWCGTESSRSRQTTSASSARAFSRNLALLPGTNARERNRVGAAIAATADGAA